jgi:hypothetical protein
MLKKTDPLLLIKLIHVTKISTSKKRAAREQLRNYVFLHALNKIQYYFFRIHFEHAIFDSLLFPLSGIFA